MRITKISTVCGLLALGAIPSFADISAVTFTGGSYYNHPISSSYQTVGWTFTTNQALNVTTLDWYSPTQGDDATDRTVDIWLASNTTTPVLRRASGPDAQRPFTRTATGRLRFWGLS